MQKVYRSEKQMHEGHRLITQNEKAQCHFLLEILKQWWNLWQPEVQEIQRILKLEAENGIRSYDIIYGRSPTDDSNDLDENAAMWCIILECHTPSCSSSWSRLFLENLRITMNQLLKSVKQLFQVTEKWSASDRPGSQTPRRSCGSALDPRFRIRNSSARLLPRINSSDLWKSYSKWLRSWSRIREILQVWPQSTTNSLRRDRRPYNVTKQLNHECQNLRFRGLGAMLGRHQYLTSSSLGKQYKMVFGNSLSQRIESNRWSSSGQFSQDSQLWAFSKRFKHLWLNCSVNLSSSKEGSSSCHCTTTLYGENEETQKSVLRIVVQLRNVLANSCPDIGHSRDLDQRRNGTNKTAEVMMLCLRSESCHSIFRATSALGRGELRSKERETSLFTSTAVKKPLNLLFA